MIRGNVVSIPVVHFGDVGMKFHFGDVSMLRRYVCSLPLVVPFVWLVRCSDFDEYVEDVGNPGDLVGGAGMFACAYVVV